MHTGTSINETKYKGNPLKFLEANETVHIHVRVLLFLVDLDTGLSWCKARQNLLLSFRLLVENCKVYLNFMYAHACAGKYKCLQEAFCNTSATLTCLVRGNWIEYGFEMASELDNKPCQSSKFQDNIPKNQYMYLSAKESHRTVSFASG